MRVLSFAALVLVFTAAAASQPEIITNRTVIEMTAAGLSSEIIAAKIRKSDVSFETTAEALIELKRSGVADPIIDLILEKAETVLPGTPPRIAGPKPAAPTDQRDTPAPASPAEAVKLARTIAFGKSSAHPSRQNLEKALLRNADFRSLDLTILRYKEEADLFVEIGFVSGSWLTHRYVYRIYDRPSGAVIAAGETTSWGSLGDNLARHISRSLRQVATVSQIPR